MLILGFLLYFRHFSGVFGFSLTVAIPESLTEFLPGLLQVNVVTFLLEFLYEISLEVSLKIFLVVSPATCFRKKIFSGVASRMSDFFLGFWDILSRFFSGAWDFYRSFY